jgi:hypothetical protein
MRRDRKIRSTYHVRTGVVNNGGKKYTTTTCVSAGDGGVWIPHRTNRFSVCILCIECLFLGY